MQHYYILWNVAFVSILIFFLKGYFLKNQICSRIEGSHFWLLKDIKESLPLVIVLLFGVDWLPGFLFCSVLLSCTGSGPKQTPWLHIPTTSGQYSCWKRWVFSSLPLFSFLPCDGTSMAGKGAEQETPICFIWQWCSFFPVEFCYC